MSSGSDTPSKRWYSRITSSLGSSSLPVPSSVTLPSTARKRSVKPRRVKPSIASSKVAYPVVPVRVVIVAPRGMADLDWTDEVAQPRRQLGVLAVVHRHVDDRWAGMGQGLGQDRPERVGRLHPVAFGAKGLRQGDEVRIAEADARFTAQVCLLLPLDQVVGAVAGSWKFIRKPPSPLTATM